MAAERTSAIEVPAETYDGCEKDTTRYFPVIKHRYKQWFHDIMYVIAKRFMASRFEEQKINGDQNLEQIAGTTKIHISNHLSELDWFTLKLKAYEKDVKLAVSAGENLFLPIIGLVLRTCGGFKSFRKNGSANKGIPQNIKRYLWKDYVEHLIHEGKYDMLIFPEADSQKKLGRSYTGTLGKFNAAIFSAIIDIQNRMIEEGLHRDIEIIPQNITYERIAEDDNFETLKDMKAKGRSSFWVYLSDFGYVFWGSRKKPKSRLTIQYGDPIVPAEFNMGKQLAERVRREVARLQTAYPTQCTAFAFGDRMRITERELLEHIKYTQGFLLESPINTSPIDALGPDDILERAVQQFKPYDYAHPANVIEYKNGEFAARKPEVLTQYANHLKGALDSF